MNIKKLLMITLIFVSIIALITPICRADDIDTLVTDMKGKDISAGDTSGGQIIKSIDSILGLVQVIGTGVAIIAISLLGIKYMLSSADDKAEIKKYLVGAVIGGILVFGGLQIAKTIAEFSDTAFTNS